MEQYSIFPLGDQAITFSFGNSIHPHYHSRVVSMEKWFRRHPFPGLIDIVVAYSSLTVIFDLYQIKNQTSAPSVFESLKQNLLEAFENSQTAAASQNKTIEVPVCYEPPFSPDLDSLCEQKEVTRAEAIAIHASKTYQVFMIGFLPGFPYMAEVDGRIRVARKPKPRSQVEAGSVGIAGIQTGIYPVQSPGGWQIIGRTPVLLFDKNRQPPVLFEAGDEVKFYPISKAEFENHKSSV